MIHDFVKDDHGVRSQRDGDANREEQHEQQQLFHKNSGLQAPMVSDPTQPCAKWTKGLACSEYGTAYTGRGKSQVKSVENTDAISEVVQVGRIGYFPLHAQPFRGLLDASKPIGIVLPKNSPEITDGKRQNGPLCPRQLPQRNTSWDSFTAIRRPRYFEIIGEVTIYNVENQGVATARFVPSSLPF